MCRVTACAYAKRTDTTKRSTLPHSMTPKPYFAASLFSIIENSTP